MTLLKYLNFLCLFFSLHSTSWAQDWFAGFVKANQAASAEQKAQLAKQNSYRWCQKYRDIPNAGYPNTVTPIVAYCLDEKQQLGSPTWLKASDKASASQLDLQRHQRQWQAILRLIPHFYRPYIKSVVFMTSQQSGAMTKAIDLPKRSFSFAIDLDQTPTEPDEVLWVHELMHVLSHRNLHTEGKNHQQAPYIHDFKNQFWKNTSINQQVAQSPQKFVSTYAMQSIEEDLAESFAAYVTSDERFRITPQNQAKLTFFDQYPETRTYKAWYRSLAKTPH